MTKWIDACKTSGLSLQSSSDSVVKSLSAPKEKAVESPKATGETPAAEKLTSNESPRGIMI